ncbi:helix-turn-helix domain-containing protein, partial [Pseudomonas sp. GD04058]|uniref:helix-turn-helix domain-containing protein n=1 Tax=Pseudomonas sp. GD04058 TaxID=2975429 RepID=UPI00244B04D6
MDARKDAQMTQQDLSARLGKPLSYVSKYEQDERRLEVIEFLQIALNLKAAPYLLRRELEP